MQHLNTLTQVVSAANSAADVLTKSETFRFRHTNGLTLYLHTTHAEIRLITAPINEIIVHSSLQLPLLWKIASEQDDAGVYIVALRRVSVGEIGTASFSVTTPPQTHLILRVQACSLTFTDINGIARAAPNGDVMITSG
jgi:hypothetical protein